MATDSLKNLVFGMILFTVIAILLLLFVIDVGDTYGKEFDNPAMNLSGLNNSLSDFEENSDTLRQNFGKGSFLNVDNVLGILGIVENMFTFIFAPFTIFGGILINILHVPVWVVGVLAGLIILSFIYGAWALARKGD